MRVNISKLAIVLATATLPRGPARAAAAQGKSHGRANPHAAKGAEASAQAGQGKAKKLASSDDGVQVTREVLQSHGYEVVRVEREGGDRVVYYRRGNMGRGKGKGPLVKMYVRQAAPDRVVFDRTPQEALAEIHRRMAQ
ncbi:MAG: hypothetical protein HOQ26_00415 [Gemmatimonadaceae bacterium]|nr:hypothetical protein [Gemmatimonadaceae bacterium]